MLLVHLSDIHIGSATTRRAEYRAVFDMTAAAINQLVGEVIVVITGDVFHHKVKYSGEDVEDFNYLIHLLQKYLVIMIPGNHDVNLNNENSVDLISPLIKWPNVKYLRDTGVYTICGIQFVHVSLIGADGAAKNGPDGDVLLYHGMVDGSKFGKNHTVNGSRISLDYINRFKLCLLGDIHQHQFVTPTAAYAGSLIQQNYGESTIKGFLVWDYKALNGKFIVIDNPHKLIAAPKQMPTDAVPKPSNISIHSDIIVDGIRNLLATRNIDPVTTAEVIKLHMEENVPITSRRWCIKYMKWRNLFKYGDDNYIDFEQLGDSISGIIANNRAGKSSVIDIMVYGMFNTFLRGSKQCVLRRGATEFEIEICFEVITQDPATAQIVSTLYKLQRKDDLKHCTLRLYKQEHSDNGITWLNITKKDVFETYAEIKTLVGDVEQLKCVGIYYDGFSDIVKCPNTSRADILSNIFGLQSVLKGKSLETKIRSLRDEIKKLGQPITVQADGAAVATSLNETKSLRDRVEAEYHSLNESLYKLRASAPKTSRDVVYAEIQQNQQLVVQNTQAIESATRALTAAEAECTLRGYTAPTFNVKIDPSMVKKDYDFSKINRVCRDIDEIKQELYNIRTEKLPPEINIDELRRKEAAILQRMKSLGIGKIDVGAANAEIKQLRAELDKLAPLHLPNSYSQLQFNSSCDKCRANQSITVDKYQETIDENARRAQLRQQINTKIDEIANTITKNDELTQLCFQHVAISTKIQDEEKIIARRREMRELERRRDELNVELAAATESRQHKDALKIHLLYNLSVAKKDLSDAVSLKDVLIAKRGDLDVKLAAHDTFDHNKLAMLQKQTQLLFAQLAELNNKIGQLSSQQAVIIAATEQQKNYDAKYPELANKLNILTLYNDIINGKELKSVVIFKCIDDVFNGMNKVLGLITDFSVSYKYDMEDRNKLDISMIEKNGKMIDGAPSDIILPVEMASGFQKFIISIIFRIVLGVVIPCAADFLIIDEGFGCMDKQHTARIIKVLEYLRNKYKFVFIVSHIDELQNIINKPLMIEQRTTAIGICSRVNNGPVDVAIIPPADVVLPQADAAAPVNAAVNDNLNDMPARIICACGAQIARSAMSRHMKTARHIAKLANK